MPYEVYKIIHLLMIVIMLTGFSIGFWGGKYGKLFKILTGVGSLLILVSGMGLMARLGIGHTEPWPLWIKLKFFFWVVLSAVGPIALKRCPQKGPILYWGYLSIFTIIVYLVNYKPD